MQRSSTVELHLNVASGIFVNVTVEERGDKSARLQQNERKKGKGLTFKNTVLEPRVTSDNLPRFLLTFSVPNQSFRWERGHIY